MIIENPCEGLTKITAEGTNKITDKERKIFVDFLYLGINDSVNKYEEVGRDVWKYFIKEDNPDVIEALSRTEDLQETVESLQNDTLVLTESQLMVDETVNIVIGAVADSDENRNILTDTMLLAVDELFVNFIEPAISIMDAAPLMCMSLDEDSPRPTQLTEEVSKMVELYVVMVQRGLRSIEQVPARYREQVKALLGDVE